ncbi:hypothetical protein SHIRM173S_01019 [Streptomyces hirsutus]
MSPGAGSSPQVPENRQSRTFSWIGTGVCGVPLWTLVTGYVVLMAHVVKPDGPWDEQAVTHFGFAAGFGLAFSVVMALLTWVFVKAEWLRRWW